MEEIEIELWRKNLSSTVHTNGELSRGSLSPNDTLTRIFLPSYSTLPSLLFPTQTGKSLSKYHPKFPNCPRTPHVLSTFGSPCICKADGRLINTLRPQSHLVLKVKGRELVLVSSYGSHVDSSSGKSFHLINTSRPRPPWP